ncbi:hypothetical protein Tco_0625568 [Tanacetum coccineum]|uniref:Uncharacterized protein n=1 Tax=Tanacetum coccineum TaxID=301880 RepID=A0ABQ4WH66_9ASTR
MGTKPSTDQAEHSEEINQNSGDLEGFLNSPCFCGEELASPMNKTVSCKEALASPKGKTVFGERQLNSVDGVKQFTKNLLLRRQSSAARRRIEFKRSRNDNSVFGYIH